VDQEPRAAIPTPIVSTTNVPTKFCMMIPRQRRASAKFRLFREIAFRSKITLRSHEQHQSPIPMGDADIGLYQSWSVVDSSPTIADIRPLLRSSVTHFGFLLRQESSTASSTSEIAANG